MKSAVVEHLKPEFEPVAVVWSDAIPDGSLEFKEGRFGCILHLFAEASQKGRVAGGSRDTIVCSGGKQVIYNALAATLNSALSSSSPRYGRAKPSRARTSCSSSYRKAPISEKRSAKR